MVKVAEAVRREYGNQVERVAYEYAIATEEGVLSVIGDLVKKVGSKISKDTFSVDYGKYILGEMSITNKTLDKSNPNGKYKQYTSVIGAMALDDELHVSIMHRDDIEDGVGGSNTYINAEFDLATFPLKDLKEGKYQGRDFEKLLDIVFRALILASAYGYEDYAREQGSVYMGTRPHFSWLTLKDGRKVTWDTYNFGELANVLKQ